MSKDREWFPDTCTQEDCFRCNQSRNCPHELTMAAIRQARIGHRTPFRVRHPWVVLGAIWGGTVLFAFGCAIALI